jgi:hypothetical protein
MLDSAIEARCFCLLQAVLREASGEEAVVDILEMKKKEPNKITPVNPALASRLQSLPLVGRVTEFRRSAA